MAKSDDLLGGALANNHGSQSSNNRGNRSDFELTIDPLLSDRKPFGKSCHPNVYPPLGNGEPEEGDKAEGNNSEVDRLRGEVSEAFAKVDVAPEVLRLALSVLGNIEDRKPLGLPLILEKTRKELEKRDIAEGNNSEVDQLKRSTARAVDLEKLAVLRQVFWEYRQSDDGKLLDALLMNMAHDLFPKGFPKAYCRAFWREIKIQVFQRINRERFCSNGQTSREAVWKEFISWIHKYWSPAEGEVEWRMKGFIFSGETLGHLQSVARKFEPTEEQKGEFKLRWRETLPTDYYYLVKAAAAADEKLHNSPEFNVIARADNEEFMFQGRDLNDFVKDITKSVHGGAKGHKQPDGAQDGHV